MKIRDVIKLAATFLELYDVSKHPALADGFTGKLNGTDETTQDIKLLVKCCNVAMKKVARSIPFYYTIPARVSLGRLNLSSFPDDAFKIVSVKKPNGRYAKFEYNGLHVFVKADGPVTVTYAGKPPIGNINSDIGYTGAPSICIGAFSCGTAVEYCKAKGRKYDNLLLVNAFQRYDRLCNSKSPIEGVKIAKKPYQAITYRVETEDGSEWVARFPEANNVGGSGRTVEEAISDATENLMFELELEKEEG